ncbi:MAG TPA: hypothetical protein VHI71_00360 [Actinomycetota bacterium]|nr:hypothetical protein [Actinomycetota bacterium]
MPHGQPLALEWSDRAGTLVLYRIDPRTLRLHDGLPLGMRSATHWDVSPDGKSLLVSSSKGQVRVVDLQRWRTTLRKRLGIRAVFDAAWVADDAAILVKVGRGETGLVRLRPSTGTVLDFETVVGTAFTSVDAGRGVVLLAYAEDAPLRARPHPATLAAMDASGRFVTSRVEEIPAGHYRRDGDDFSARALPALAVEGSRATVVTTDGNVVSVDLTDLDVTVEGEDRSLFDELAAWFAPPAYAKTLDGTQLRAEWASPDALLVSGYRTAASRGPRAVTEPLGAVLLDADDWSATVVDEDANGARMADGLLLAWNVFMIGDERREGIGLRAYESDGELAWHVLEGQFVHMVGVHGDVAFVQHGWHRVLVSSVDLRTGDVLQTRDTTPVILSS